VLQFFRHPNVLALGDGSIRCTGRREPELPVSLLL